MAVQRLRIASAIVALVLGVLGAPAPAVAQQGWISTVQQLSFAGHDAAGAHVALDPAGNGIAVWSESDGVTVSVWAAFSSLPTGDWRIPERLSPAAQNAYAPRVGVDGQGNVLVVWVREAGGVYYLQGLRGSTTAAGWSTPIDIATIGTGGIGPDLAVTPGGNAVVVWTAVTSTSPVAISVHAARFVTATGAWTSATQISSLGDNAYLARVAVAPGGDAVAVWSKEDSSTTELVQAARFDAASATWQTPATVSASASYAEEAVVAMDASGDAVVAWLRTSNVEVARYEASAATWSPASIRSTGVAVNGPGLASDADGNVTVLWHLGTGVVETTRYDAVVAAWSATQPIPGATGSGTPAVAADPSGNVVAFWPSPTLLGSSAQGVRYVRATNQWTPVSTLPTSGPPDSVHLAADGVGNVAAVWHRDSSTPAVYATRWSGAPAAPAISAILATTAGVTLHVSPPVTTEPAFAPTAYEYSVAARPWVRVPFSSPIAISGLSVGPWVVLVRAINGAGSGAFDQRLAEIPPDPPLNLAVVAVNGNQVTLAWEPPAGATSEFTFVIEGGVAPGQVLANLPTGSSVPAFTFTAPSGVFYLRVRTAYFQLRSQPSNEVVLAVNVAAPPSPPSALSGMVNGSEVALSWTNTFAGGAPTGVSLVVNGPVSGVVPLGLTDRFQFPSVPAGTYTFQVVATNVTGSSAASNAVSLTFPGACSGVPHPPLRLFGSQTGRLLSVGWSPPETGAAVTSYVLLVSGAFNGAVPWPTRAISASVPPGAYTFRVRAVNPCGASAPTAPVTVVVP